MSDLFIHILLQTPILSSFTNRFIFQLNLYIVYSSILYISISKFISGSVFTQIQILSNNQESMILGVYELSREYESFGSFTDSIHILSSVTTYWTERGSSKTWLIALWFGSYWLMGAICWTIYGICICFKLVGKKRFMSSFADLQIWRV